MAALCTVVEIMLIFSCFISQAGLQTACWCLSALTVHQAVMGNSASDSRDAGGCDQQPVSAPTCCGPAPRPHPPYQKPQASAVLPAWYAGFV